MTALEGDAGEGVFAAVHIEEAVFVDGQRGARGEGARIIGADETGAGGKSCAGATELPHLEDHGVGGARAGRVTDGDVGAGDDGAVVEAGAIDDEFTAGDIGIAGEGVFIAGDEGRGALAGFVDPAGAGKTFADMVADLQYLCDNVALPSLAANKWAGGEVILSVSNIEIDFGETAPDVTQFFQPYEISGEACIWGDF